MEERQNEAQNIVPDKLLKPYNPTETEGRIYSIWEDSGFFNPDNLPERHTEPFTIIMPPPNANGRLHAGHGLTMTLQDIFIRYARMNGKKALWVPGADHAGFETQIVYEKKLEKEGRSRFDLDRETLYKKIYDFTIENKKFMEDDTKRIGSSCDWSRERFTLDPSVVKAAQSTFYKMFNDGLVYRGERIVNWCPKHQTSLSDVETEFVEKNDSFYYLQYGPFVIGTARPETKFGDKYVVMHPSDQRYSSYEHGQKIDLEWINGPITATVIKDESIDMDFGTGVMTITPWHDQTDFEIAERHNLEKEQIIDFNGKLLPIAGEFAGEHISKARIKIIEKLQSKGLVVKIDNEYKHNIKTCYKCSTTIEPQIKDQWFVKMEPLAKKALNAVNEGKIKFYPDNFEKIFRYWMENTIDWNISRQIVWGIPIPAKICSNCKTAVLDTHEQNTCSCSGDFIKDTDTFDTWFSSGQWPLLALGYPDNQDYKTYHPTQIMETGRDLIFKWIPRMVIFSLYLENEVPFQNVYLHGMVNDAKGQKMSKSKGNVISPIELIDEFGADAFRIGMVVGNTPGSDVSLSKDKIKGYKHFANKLWNITRFILSTSVKTKDEKPDSLSEYEINLLKELESTLKDVTLDIENYRLYLASEKLYHYVWHNLADKLIEESKDILKNGTEQEKYNRSWVLMHILKNSIKALHPFMPFITEELWSLLPHNNTRSLLLVEKWPTTSNQ